MNGETISNCEEALRLLAAYLDGELDAAEHESVEHHLRLCRSCCSRAEFERHLKAQLGRLRQAGVDPSFEQRIRGLISQFTSLPAPERPVSDRKGEVW
jgi:anti-sigma factor RsiW